MTRADGSTFRAPPSKIGVEGELYTRYELAVPALNYGVAARGEHCRDLPVRAGGGKLATAVIGPKVCELDGPKPTIR